MLNQHQILANEYLLQTGGPIRSKTLKPSLRFFLSKISLNALDNRLWGPMTNTIFIHWLYRANKNNYSTFTRSASSRFTALCHGRIWPCRIRPTATCPSCAFWYIASNSLSTSVDWRLIIAVRSRTPIVQKSVLARSCLKMLIPSIGIGWFLSCIA